MPPMLDDTLPSFNPRHEYYNSVHSSIASSSTLPGGSFPTRDKFSLPADPYEWGLPEYMLTTDFKEDDDTLHNPEVRGGKIYDAAGWLSMRSLMNLGCLFVLAIGILALFAGYPIVSYVYRVQLSRQGGFNLGAVNATGQIPAMGNWGLIDLDTPKDVYTKTSWADGSTQLQLVFSDEFNTDGRTFYPSDDPYFEAHDLNYWGTNNLEWYDPAGVTTANGSLVLTLSQKETHGLHYQGAMLTSWNKFCFTGGLIEANVALPGVNNIVGLWPAVWTLGNLGRAGYGASLDGTWPYTYDSCDVGTVKNQSINGLPIGATVGGDSDKGGELSYMPGQRLSRCTCEGESHPGPKHADGSYVGRSAPEIDIIEAQVGGDPLTGHVSQSAQWAPFDANYEWNNTTDTYSIYDPELSELNSYKGGGFQQASSAVTKTNPSAYDGTAGQFSLYAFEYKPGFDNSYITWVSDNKLAWSLKGEGLQANPITEIAQRPVPQEPMYIIINLGMSFNFGVVDLEHLTFPARMLVDYIRVYQRPDSLNTGCDPADFPTAKYIETYKEAYTNPNLTTWVDDFKQVVPKNRLVDQC